MNIGLRCEFFHKLVSTESMQTQYRSATVLKGVRKGKRNRTDTNKTILKTEEVEGLASLDFRIHKELYAQTMGF